MAKKNFFVVLDKYTTGTATVLAGGALVIASLCGIYQVFMRFLFNNPSDWTEVLTRVMLIWMVYVGTAVAVRQGALVSVDLLRQLCKGKWKLLIEGFITGVTLLLLSVMVWQGFNIAWRIRFQNIAGLDIPMSWAYLAIPVGAVFAIIAVIAHFFDPVHHELETAQ